MKKLSFLLILMIISLGAWAQPKIFISNVPNGTFNPSNPFNFLDEKGDFNGDGKNDLLTGQSSRASIFFYGTNGLSAIPRSVFYENNVAGASVLQTLDSVASFQMIYDDTLATFINDSVGLKFSAFKQSVDSKSVILRTSDIFSQYSGEETFIVDSTWRSVKLYHFNGVNCDLLQTIQIVDTIFDLEFADFNQDNLDELVIFCSPADSGFASAKIYQQNDSLLSFWKEVSLNKRQLKSAKIADIFQDGFPDMVISSFDSLDSGISIVGLVDTLLNPTFLNYSEKPYTEIVIGDFNSDHYLDIIALIAGLDSAAIYRNNQEGQMIYDSLFYTKCGSAIPKNHSAVAFDCDNSGALDLLLANGFDGLIRNLNLTPAAPDLEIISLGFSNLFQLGNNYQQSMTLKIGNVGEAMATDDSLSARITFSIKSLADSLLTEKIINQAFDSLVVGDSLALNFVLDSIYIPNGSKLEIFAQINPNQQLTELTLKNNFLKNEWQFAFPDLTISEIQIDTNEDSFLQGSVRIDVENIGCEIADSSNTKIKIFLKHGDSTYYSEEFDNPTASLNPNEKAGLYFYLENLPDSLNISAQDSLIVEIFVDHELEIEEADESNNELSLRLYLADFLSLTSISEVADFSVYPNPTTGIINLVIPTFNENLEIYNSLGQRIWSQKVAQEAQIDLSNLPNGWYCLKIGNLTKKIIKK